MSLVSLDTSPPFNGIPRQASNSEIHIGSPSAEPQAKTGKRELATELVSLRKKHGELRWELVEARIALDHTRTDQWDWERTVQTSSLDLHLVQDMTRLFF